MIVFGKASDIVMGQYVRMLIVADEGLDVIAVIAFQSVGSTYPDETFAVLHDRIDKDGWLEEHFPKQMEVYHRAIEQTREQLISMKN